MKEEILEQAIARLKETKKEIIDRINSYEDELKRYRESNKELNDNLSVEVYNEKTEKWTNSLKACKNVKDIIQELDGQIKEQKNLVNNVINYNINFGDLDKFFDMVLEIDGYDVQNFYGDCTKISKATMIKFPFKASDISNFNTTRGIILMKADYIVSEKSIFGHANSNKALVAKEIQDMLRSSKMFNFYDTMIKYFSDNLKRVDLIAKENGQKIQEIRTAEINKRKEEIDTNIEELNRKIDECKKSLVSIGEIYKLYEKYNTDKDQSTLIRLADELSNLVVISQRETKIIKYEPTEKEEKEKEETTSLEEKVVEEKPNVLDSDYFRRSDTKHLICFLGEENDSIKNDILKHFDNSARKPVLSELYNIFNSLAVENDYIKDKGGNPHSGSAKNALALLKSPFDFEYRRYGVRNDGFRIHAISRYSSLLKELGYGSGKIIFFGAIGVNDDKLKSDAYNRLGKRAIEERSYRGKTAKLRPNFDYIEHITRRYIPIKFLSEDDKVILNFGGFKGMTKGKIERSIEDCKYVLYDILDDDSKNNVKKYLDEYFINQTSMLFDIIENYKKEISLD